MPSSSPPNPTIQKCLLPPHSKACRAGMSRVAQVERLQVCVRTYGLYGV